MDMSENKFDELNKGRKKKYSRHKDHRFNKKDSYDYDSSLKFKDSKGRQNNWKKRLDKIEDDEE